MPVFLLYLLSFFFYEILTGRMNRNLKNSNGNVDVLIQMYNEKLREGLVRIDYLIPYIWAFIMIIASFFILKNNIS